MRFFLVFYLFASPFSHFTFLHSSNTSHRWYHPYKAVKSIKIKKISDFKVAQTNAGYFLNPNHTELFFSLWDSENQIDTKKNVLIEIKLKKSEKTVKKWQKNAIYSDNNQSYFVKLQYPYLPINSSDLGPYKIELSLKENPLIKAESRPHIYFEKSKINILFIIDQSTSMNKNDPQNLRIQSIIQLLKNKRYNKNIHRVSAIGFSDNVSLWLPWDSLKKNPQKIFKKLNDQLEYKPYGKTQIGLSLEYAIKQMAVPTLKGRKVILFLTDGVPTTSPDRAVEKIVKLGIPIYTVGLASTNSLSTDFDEKLLKSLANKTGGKYLTGNNSSLENIFNDFIKTAIKKKNYTDIQAIHEVLFKNEMPEIKITYPSLIKKISIACKKLTPYKIIHKNNLAWFYFYPLAEKQKGKIEININDKKYLSLFEIKKIKARPFKIEGLKLLKINYQQRQKKFYFTFLSKLKHSSVLEFSLNELSSFSHSNLNNAFSFYSKTLELPTEKKVSDSLNFHLSKNLPIGYHNFLLVFTMDNHPFIMESSLEVKNKIKTPLTKINTTSNNAKIFEYVLLLMLSLSFFYFVFTFARVKYQGRKTESPIKH